MIVSISPPAKSTVRKAIMQGMIDDLNHSMRTARISAQDDIRKLTKRILENSLFFRDFVGGTGSRGDFGIRPGEARPRINAIVQEICNDTHLFFTPLKLSGLGIDGEWLLAMGTNLFEDLKMNPAGITVTEKYDSLPWMEWMLERGSAVIISEYKIDYGKFGRSGFAHMVPDALETWRVNPLFEGTDHDNWITREVIPNLDKYTKVLERNIRKYIP